MGLRKKERKKKERKKEGKDYLIETFEASPLTHRTPSPKVQYEVRGGGGNIQK